MDYDTEAAEHGQAEIASLLIEHGADVNARMKTQATALMRASENGRHESVSRLLAVDTIDVNATDNQGWTALMHAAWNKRTECVRLLLADARVDASAVNEDGKTALALALVADREDPDIVSGVRPVFLKFVATVRTILNILFTALGVLGEILISRTIK